MKSKTHHLKKLLIKVSSLLFLPHLGEWSFLKKNPVMLFTSCLKLSLFVACVYSPPSHSELCYFIKTSFSLKPLSSPSLFFWPGIFSAIVSFLFYSMVYFSDLEYFLPLSLLLPLYLLLRTCWSSRPQLLIPSLESLSSLLWKVSPLFTHSTLHAGFCFNTHHFVLPHTVHPWKSHYQSYSSWKPHCEAPVQPLMGQCTLDF